MWRHPPRLGVVGFDGGTKPAMALVVPPPQSDRETEAEGEYDEPPVTCVAEVELYCRQVFVEKVICGFPALDGSIKRFAHAQIHWTLEVHRTEAVPSNIATDDAEVDVLADFESATRVVDEGASTWPENCDSYSESCETSNGTLQQVITYRDATPTYDFTADSSCAAGTTYGDVPLNGGFEAQFNAALGSPPFEPSFIRCSFPGFSAVGTITDSSGTWNQNDSFITGTETCNFDETLVYTLTDEITFSELAAEAAVTLDDIGPVSADPGICELAQFIRFNDYQGDQTTAIHYSPLAFSFFRVAPATGDITCVYTINTYFPDPDTLVDSQELSVVISDGQDWSPDILLEPDLLYPGVNDADRLYMRVLFTPGDASC